MGPFFYQACSKKQGAGLVRILASAGLKCNQEALDLAVSRKCWHVALAMVPAIDQLSPPIETFSGHGGSFPLLQAIMAGQLDLARALLPLYRDRAYAANVALHNLARMTQPARETANAIAWLVSEGAEPNQHFIRNTHPLEAALTSGTRKVDISLALVRAGAMFSFPHAMIKVIKCVQQDYEENASHVDRSDKISAAGWELIEEALTSGLRLPPLISTIWGTQYFQGTEKLSGQLHATDIEKVRVIQERVILNKHTPSPSISASRSRL